MYCRINLANTDYKELPYYKVLTPNSFESIKAIYNSYCDYKKFKSRLPLYIEDFDRGEILGYYIDNNLVAFSLNYLYPSQKHAYAEQFAWDYQQPKLRLGIKSLESECARYKRIGYEYLYLGEYDEYKSTFQGFETV